MVCAKLAPISVIPIAVNLFFKEFNVVKFAIDAFVPTIDVTLLPNAVMVSEFLIMSAALPVILRLIFDLMESGKALIIAKLAEVISVADRANGTEFTLPVILKLTFDLIASGKA